MTATLAPAGSPHFNRELASTLESLGRAMRARFGPSLVALVLGGGYGRGEGAVRHVDGRERAYNDLDLFAVSTARTLSGVDEVCRPFAERLGVHVDVGRPLRVEEIRRWSPALMWYDLVHGHRVVVGDAGILRDNVPGRVRRELPAHEAVRLLLNRGMGLLWALRVAHGVAPAPEGDADFVRRNAFKTMLALGDAPLIAHGRYVSAAAGRGSRFVHLSREHAPVAALGVEAAFMRALRFKVDPDRFAGPVGREALGDLALAWERVLLYVDGVRAGAAWRDLDGFCSARPCREPGAGHWTRWPANAARNLSSGRLSVTHPRERLYRELPRLLAGAGAPTAGWAAASADALSRWRRFQ